MKTKTMLWTLPLAAAMTTAAFTGRAEAGDPDPYEVDRDRYPSDRQDHLLTDIGMGFSLGGGIENFTDDRINAITDPGANWTARLIFGTRRPLALEAAYIGSVNNLETLGLDESALLMGNGVEGVLRLNFLTEYAVQPYIFGGAAWKHYNVVNESFNTSSVNDSDDVLEVPIGTGVAIHYEGLLIDGRIDYRPTFDEELLRPVGDRSSATAGLENWNVSAKVGFEF